MKKVPNETDIKVLRHVFQLLSLLLKREEIVIDFSKVASVEEEAMKKAIKYLEKKGMVVSTKNLVHKDTGATLLNHLSIINIIPDDYLKSTDLKGDVEDADTRV
jgi:hypothetical protein